MIELSEFEMVETISTTGSLTRAADTLFVSQPTLSKRLARLEAQLGAKLFHRAPTGLQPTLVANYLIKSAGPLKARVSGIERQVERLLAHDLGELRIGVGPIVEQVLLPGVLIALTKQTGTVRCSVQTDRAEVLLEQLKSGALDVIAGPFHTGPPTDREGLPFADEAITAIELIQERTINVARAGHPLFEAEDPDFFAYPYASPPLQGTMVSNVGRGLERRRLSTDNYALLKEVTLETDFICGGPREIFRNELASGRMRVVPDSPTVEWRSACLLKTEALETPLVKLFVDLLIEYRDRYLEDR
ncbi:MAG: LysR family transcriptional regulator [Pseudomonadota bacterium]